MIVVNVVLTFRYDDQVWHIRIILCERGFGFVDAVDSDFYLTLTQLVHYYNKQSLQIHNKFLDTTLMFPVKVLQSKDESFA